MYWVAWNTRKARPKNSRETAERYVNNYYSYYYCFCKHCFTVQEVASGQETSDWAQSKPCAAHEKSRNHRLLRDGLGRKVALVLKWLHGDLRENTWQQKIIIIRTIVIMNIAWCLICTWYSEQACVEYMSKSFSCTVFQVSVSTTHRLKTSKKKWVFPGGG